MEGPGIVVQGDLRAPPHQAAEVSSAACHITQTKPPHDASDNASRTQRAMTASPLRVPGMFYVLVWFPSSGMLEEWQS